MDFWRGEAYSAFFDYLDSHGGFYYEVRPMTATAPQYELLIYMFRMVNSVGVMHLFTRLVRRSSPARIGYSFSARSDTNMHRTHTVLPKRTYGSKLAVVVSHRRASVNSTDRSFAITTTDMSSAVVSDYRL